MTKSDDKRVPALRFKGFTDEWEQRKLGNLVTFSKGKGYTKKDLTEKGVPIFLYGTLYTNFHEKYDDIHTYVKMRSGSIISNGSEVVLPDSGETALDIARASWISKKGVILAGGLLILYPKDNISSEFLAYSLTYGRNHKTIATKAQGKSIVHIHKNDLENIFYRYPRNVNNQKRIIKILDKLNKCILLQQRKVKLINKLKNALLTHFISKTSSQSASKTLKDITNIRGGYAFKSSEFTKSGFPVIKIANISQNGEIEGPYSYVLSLKSDYQLAKNDIVLAMSGATTGKIARVNSNNIYLQNQRVGYFVNNHKIDYNYLYYLLISDQFKRQLERILISGAQPNVSASDIEKFKFVILKSKKQQSKISTLFKHIDYALKAGNNKIHTLIQIKQFLLQNMFI